MTTTTTEAKERLTTPPAWADVLASALELPGKAGDTYNRFYRYSIGNQVLLMMQGLFEPVATYKGWQKLGRQVQKGSKAKSIYVPMIRKEETDEGTTVEHLAGFKLVPSIFGVSETEGEELPPYEPPTWSKERALEALKVSETSFDVTDGNIQGYSYERTVAINPVAVYPFKTLIHELAHIAAGHTSPQKQMEYLTHRGLMEFEAEGTAYLVLNELGALEQFDAAESRAYIQGWLSGEKPADASIKHVFATADKILKAGLPA